MRDKTYFVPRVEQISQLIVAPRDAVHAVVASGELGRPFCDCKQTNAAQVLTELGCKPELVFRSAASDARSVALFRVREDQLLWLAEVDPEFSARFNEPFRGGGIVLRQGSENYSELYSQAVAIARTTVELNQSLFARLEFINSRMTS